MDRLIRGVGRYAMTGVEVLRDVRVVAAEIGTLILLYFLGLVLPQKWMFENRGDYEAWLIEGAANRLLDYVGFTEIYLSPITIVVLVLFFLSLMVVTADRLPVMFRRAYLTGKPPSFNAEQVRRGAGSMALRAPGEPAEVGRRAREFFKLNRWYVRDAGEGSLLAVRNRFSPLGFLLFHGSFFLCLFGALMLMYTRFSGNLVITEGQAFQGDIAQFRSISAQPKALKAMEPLGLYVRKVMPTYDQGQPTSLNVELDVTYGNVKSLEVAGVNEPIRRGAYSVLVNDIGVSPLFVVKGPSGKEMDGAYVSLKVLMGGEDSFQFDSDKRYTFYVNFFPDYDVVDGKEVTRSLLLKNPAVRLKVVKAGEFVYEGTLLVGQSAPLEQFSLTFQDVKYWAEFIVVREYGRAPLFAGFAMAAIGLLMRLVFYQKRLRLAFAPDGQETLIYIGARSEQFQYSFREEADAIVKDLGEHLGGSGA